MNRIESETTWYSPSGIYKGTLCRSYDPKDKKSLEYAVTSSDVNAVRLLLSAGASPNLANSEGETPLLLAVKHGDAHSIQELLDAGANSGPVNAQPCLKLRMAVLLKDRKTVESLLKAGVPANYVGVSRDTPLMLAIRNDDKKMVQILIDAGADVTYVHNEEDEYEEISSPLHVRFLCTILKFFMHKRETVGVSIISKSPLSHQNEVTIIYCISSY
ncbi:hypothetical protein QAD02_000181 [Eretmocerus hayati]|uniref:Uncharacterized protein n=1 Tax=Eretmocerus hayati TaxID=131215 RepID=A0ACC2NF98_9HYME|nr:hypothetical protein QAD02_000181 [Eretmocerus hayati]